MIEILIMKLYGIILAAGESSRMGSPKALLKIEEKTFADIIEEKLRRAGVSASCIVLGCGAAEIEKSLNADRLNIIINPQWKKGQLSSLKAAVKKIPADASGALVCLIDHPMVKLSTIGKMICLFKKENPHGVIPVFRDRGGHPVVFSKGVFGALIRAPLNEGARAVTKNNRFNFLRVEVDDPYVIQDIDTPGDYEKIGK